MKRRLFGFTVMGCLLDIFYEIWNVVPKLLIELKGIGMLSDPVADQRRNSVLNASVQV